MHFSRQSTRLQLLLGHHQVCLDKDHLGTAPTTTYQHQANIHNCYSHKCTQKCETTLQMTFKM